MELNLHQVSYLPQQDIHDIVFYQIDKVVPFVLERHIFSVKFKSCLNMIMFQWFEGWKKVSYFLMISQKYEPGLSEKLLLPDWQHTPRIQGQSTSLEYRDDIIEKKRFSKLLFQAQSEMKIYWHYESSYVPFPHDKNAKNKTVEIWHVG